MTPPAEPVSALPAAPLVGEWNLEHSMHSGGMLLSGVMAGGCDKNRQSKSNNYCASNGCKNSYGNCKDSKISLFRFPKAPER